MGSTFSSSLRTDITYLLVLSGCQQIKVQEIIVCKDAHLGGEVLCSLYVYLRSFLGNLFCTLFLRQQCMLQSHDSNIQTSSPNKKQLLIVSHDCNQSSTWCTGLLIYCTISFCLNAYCKLKKVISYGCLYPRMASLNELFSKHQIQPRRTSLYTQSHTTTKKEFQH